jgi:hypothetical protein
MALLTCPDCEREVSDAAASCPRCGRPMRDEEITVRYVDRGMSTGMKFMLFMLGLVVLGGLGSLFADDPTEAPVYAAAKSAEDARVACRAMVTQGLKAPSTAEFLYGAESVQRADSTAFLVRGSVDAENSFGANLRTVYTCALRYSADTGEWESATFHLGD